MNNNAGLWLFERCRPAYLVAIGAIFLITACEQPQTEPADGPTRVAALPTPESEVIDVELADGIYRIEYLVTPLPASGEVKVTMRLIQDEFLLREVDMRAPGSQFRNVSGDGAVSHDGVRLHWQPPENGGEISWTVTIDHRRNAQSYDAYMVDDWAIFRGEDIIPPLSARTQVNAASETTLTFLLPQGWSAATQYFGRNYSYVIDNPERRFDRPAGWILLGKLGARRETIADVRVSIAAPIGQNMRRMDTLALLRWTLPELVRLFPEFPRRLTIIGAADPMWRGGLSGPRSLFMHTDRPLLSENGTSTLVHELVHVAMGGRAAPGADWIVEGIAEYYSLEILRRSGTTSDARFDRSLRMLANWGKESDTLCKDRSNGASTALAVTILSALNVEIQQRTDGKHSFDDVTRVLAQVDDDITIEALQATVFDLLGTKSRVLTSESLLGCDI